MNVKITRGAADDGLSAIVDTLHEYGMRHPEASVELYRQNPVSVRIRVVNPNFAGKTKMQRGREVWPFLDRLPREIHSDISTLLLLTPAELSTSYANLEFEDPVPSEL